MRFSIVRSRVLYALRLTALAALPLGLICLAPTVLEAQTTTGSIRGSITSAEGAPVPAVTVVARSIQTNQTRGTQTNDAGVYFIAGLRPGQYELTVRRVGMEPQSRTISVLIGDTRTADFRLSSTAVTLEAVQIVATDVTDTRTSEVATNVTREQIRALPQQDRNFLNFAALAPGVTASRDELNKQISANGLPASRINVFVDGASLKNDILEGGVHGQDASRGNPFPQLAIQEFRVITQNFKAEYQRAASAVVTATTRSGTNDFEFEGFVLGQNKGLVALNPGARLQCELENVCNAKPEYERLQVGASAGGPLVRDRLFLFAGYEGNYQNRQAIVSVGRPDEFRERFAQYEGVFDQPFRSHLPFAKLTWTPTPDQTLDVSYNGRFESDTRGFGGNTSFESAEDVEIGYNIVTVQHGWSLGDFFNQAHVSAQRSTWNPTVVNKSQDIGQDYSGIIRIGARDTEQRFVQDRISLRNDLTYSGLQWAGTHVFKAGVNVDFLNYDVEKRFNGNPLFIYDPGQSMEIPDRAVYGLGDPGMDESNTQFGLFIQDDWDVTDRLQLNLGIRWDAETNQFNNEWVTPDSIRQQFGAGVTPLPNQQFAEFDPDDYFTSGEDDRPVFLGAFQPRLGFSFDVTGTGSTVLHGGLGVYYDREIWNHLLDERFRLQWRVLTFPFTTTGEPGEIPWQDSYLSREGLESILNQANAPGLAELFLLNNDTRPPRTHQWNVGVRQQAWGMVLGAAYRGVRGYDIMSWYCATPQSESGFCEGLLEQGTPNFRAILLSTDEGRSWYDALDLTLEKPFLGTGWGATITYTLAEAERKGQTFFTLEYPGVDPRDWPREKQNIERHRITASGIVALPYDFLLSTLVQWGSGVPFNRLDEGAGIGPARQVLTFASEDAPSFRQVDLRLQKDFTIRGTGRVGLVVEAVNVFDHDNFRGFEQLYRFTDGQLNQRFGRPIFDQADTGRRLQVGLNFGYSSSGQ